MLLIWAAIEITREIIYADSTLEESRFRPEYFTRCRFYAGRESIQTGVFYKESADAVL